MPLCGDLTERECGFLICGGTTATRSSLTRPVKYNLGKLFSSIGRNYLTRLQELVHIRNLMKVLLIRPCLHIIFMCTRYRESNTKHV